MVRVPSRLISEAESLPQNRPEVMGEGAFHASVAKGSPFARHFALGLPSRLRLTGLLSVSLCAYFGDPCGKNASHGNFF